MKAILFRCPPGGQFHFGRIALDDKTSLDDTSTTYHSDTLCSALIATAYNVFDTATADEVLKTFMAGSVRFSSLFFCLENKVGKGQDAEQRHVFFLPKPIHLDLGDYEQPKRVRKVMAISKGVWEAGLLPAEWWDEKNDKGETVFTSPCKVLDGKFVVLKTELEALGRPKLPGSFKLFDTDTLPKVKIHQPKREDNLYFHGNLFLSGSTSPSVHFYTIVEHDLSDAAWSKIATLLDLIADEGIGGERSVGCGRLLGIGKPFDFNIAPASPSERSATLSLVSPADNADLGKLLSWKTVTRGGRFVSSELNTYRLKMVAEGALTTSGLTGRFHDITHQAKSPHLRFGHALTLPLHKLHATHGDF